MAPWSESPSYHLWTIVDGPFDSAVVVTTGVLSRHGFGVPSDIDVQATLKKKPGVDFHPYRILGTCNPQMAYKALQAQAKIGTMLPCNVVVQPFADGKVEVVRH